MRPELKVGDPVILVYRRGRAELEVCKVGRKWLYVGTPGRDERSWTKVDRATWRGDNSWITTPEQDAIDTERAALFGSCRQVFGSYSFTVGGRLTLDQLRRIVAVLDEPPVEVTP